MSSILGLSSKRATYSSRSSSRTGLPPCGVRQAQACRIGSSTPAAAEQRGRECSHTTSGENQVCQVQNGKPSACQPYNTIDSMETLSSSQRCNRRGLFGAAVTLGLVLTSQQQSQALPRGSIDARVAASFNTALAAGGDPVAADKAWTDAIAIDPSNPNAWSNRGTSRLQFGRWQDAKEDLEKALELESKTGQPSGLLLNQLGNAEGAVQDWELACKHYKQAAVASPEIESLALANLALANCELGRDSEALKVARNILRKDPEFLDVRCASTAFLWAMGEAAGAEGEWNQLQLAQDGLGGVLYNKLSALDRVKGRWPPRATAALDAFLSVSNSGVAKGYDGRVQQYDF